MDTQLFATRLTTTFVDPRSPQAPLPGLQDVVDSTEGMSTAHSLTVLSLAVSGLGADEIYLEVGSYRGRSLIGALRHNPEVHAIGIENFGEFDAGAAAKASLETALQSAGVADRVRLIYVDAFAFLARAEFEAPVGVYFYDGVHSAYGQYAGLGLAERHLADHAIVIVDDASWPQVARATNQYMDRHNGYTLIHEFPADTQDDPVWCNGLRVYEWNRPAGWQPPGRDVTVRAALQSHITGPARSLAWRTLGRHPKVMATVRRIVTGGSTTVPNQRDPS